MPLIDPVRIKTILGPLAGRFDVDALDCIDSSNSELSRRADAGAPGGSVLVVDQQTAGRGRRGRVWLSKPEDSLTFSVLWRFSGPAGQLSGLSLAVGVALARALNQQGVAGVRLKWPNDVLLVRAAGFAKVAGILIELNSDRRGTSAIIGIGLNLQAPTESMPQPVAGIVEAMPGMPDRHVLLAAILRELSAAMVCFGDSGFAALQAEWQILNAWRDQAVRVVDDPHPEISGICRGVDTNGYLLLEQAGGVCKIHSGDVSLRQA